VRLGGEWRSASSGTTSKQANNRPGSISGPGRSLRKRGSPGSCGTLHSRGTGTVAAVAVTGGGAFRRVWDMARAGAKALTGSEQFSYLLIEDLLN
jgi:hypothetical protein